MKKLLLLTTLSILALFLSSCTGLEIDSEIDFSQNDTPEIETPEIDIITEELDETITPISEENDSTRVEIIEEDEVFCIELYQPVCGMVLAEDCEEGKDCEYLKQTFSNSCYAEKAKAINIEEGPCE